MRSFHIDFTNPSNLLPDGYILGNQGEHNATELIITPPQEMTDNEKITSLRIAFELTNCRAVHSESIAKADVISLPLFSQITSSDTVAVQLEGYDSNGDLVVKSEKVTKLKFNPSVCGVETPPVDFPNSMAAEVTVNTNFRKDFGEDEEGNLTYKGNSIGSGSRQTSTVSLEYNVDIMANETSTGVTLMLTAEGIIPNGAELKTIRFNREGQMIDIREMFKTDDIPYILNMSKVIISDIYALPIIAVISFFSEKNTVISELLNYQISVLEVEYYIQ